ncbi:sulfotransferase [Mactra antiquata]
MTEIQVADAGGDEMTMVDFGEFRSSLFGRDVNYIRDLNYHLKDFKFMDGDILLCSYPKSGTTWTFEILTMLLNGSANVSVPSKINTMLEATCSEEIDQLCSAPRLLNTHLPYRRIPSDLCNKKVKIVFVVRNPKDTAVSFYNMISAFKHYNYSGKFENWLPLFCNGGLAYDTYMKYLKDWDTIWSSKKHDMTVLYFEDLKQDTLSGVQQLIKFLNIQLDEEIQQQIADKCQFKEMKSRYTPQMLGSSSYKEGTPYSFMRKGEVGNWKEWFTVAQSESMDRLVDEQLKNTKFKLVYELP